MSAMQEVCAVGKISAPPQALVVAVSARLADAVRAARRRQFARQTVGILALMSIAAGAALSVEFAWGTGRAVALAETCACGVWLIVGSFVRQRPLELGTGLFARDGRGRVDLAGCLRGWSTLAASAVREAAEGFFYGVRPSASDPAAELAAWAILALSPPHGPGEGIWVPMDEFNKAGPFKLPEDLRPAMAALSAQGWVEIDRSVYPPRARLTGAGSTFVKGPAS